MEEEEQIENDIQQELDEIVPEFNPSNLKLKQSSPSELSVVENLTNQMGSGVQRKGANAAQDDSSREILQFICNVFLKYLEMLYSLKTGKKQD